MIYSRLFGILFVMISNCISPYTHSQTEFKSIESALEAHQAGAIVKVLNLKKQKLEIIPEEIQGFTELIESLKIPLFEQFPKYLWLEKLQIC
jgi:hypothetical protein